MVGGRRTISTCGKFAGPPAPLDKSEPPTFRQVIQYSYFLLSTCPDLTEVAISALIAKDIISIWKAVIPHLPLINEKTVVNKVKIVCFQKAKQINRKSLSVLQVKFLQQKLDALFDIASCTCKLPALSCDDENVKCNKEDCQTEHIICTCPLEKKVPVEARKCLKDQRIKKNNPIDISAIKKRKKKPKTLKQQRKLGSLPNETSTSHDQNAVLSHSSDLTEGLSRKRHQYSIEYKLNAIAKWRELKENTSLAARHPDINVDRQTLKGWITNEQSYRAMSNKKVAKRLRKKSHNNNDNNDAEMKDANTKEIVVRFVRPNLPEPSPLGYSARHGTLRRTRNSSASLSSMDFLIQQDSLSQPSSAKFPKQPVERLENQHMKKKMQKSMTHSAQQSRLAPHRQLQVTISPVAAPPAARQMQVFAPSVQVPKQEKQVFVVADHERCVMSNLSSLWKSGKLCDAGISNGTSTVKVHKLVLSAVCPRLLSVLNADVLPHEFLQVNFPSEVSVEALNAFAEYMYNGILDLDRDILEQLKIIAKRLDMSEFEELCDSHLPNHVHQTLTADPSLNHIPSIQTSVPISAMTSALVSSSTAIQSATTQVIDIKQEITDAELVQVQKDTTAVFDQELAVSSPNSKKSANVTGFVLSSGVKTEPISPDDNQYGCLSSNENQVLTTTVSSSASSLETSTKVHTSVPTSAPEFFIPFLQSTDVKSTRLKTPIVSDPSPISRFVKMNNSQSDSMNENVSKKSDSLFPVDNISTTADHPDKTVYPVELFSAKGDNLPLSTPPATEPMTVNCLFTK